MRGRERRRGGGSLAMPLPRRAWPGRSRISQAQPILLRPPVNRSVSGHAYPFAEALTHRICLPDERSLCVALRHPSTSGCRRMPSRTQHSRAEEGQAGWFWYRIAARDKGARRCRKNRTSSQMVQRFLSAHDQVANVFPAAETTTPPQTGPAAPRRSPPGPTSPAPPRLHIHAYRPASLTPSRFPSICRSQVDGALRPVAN